MGCIISNDKSSKEPEAKQEIPELEAKKLQLQLAYDKYRFKAQDLERIMKEEEEKAREYLAKKQINQAKSCIKKKMMHKKLQGYMESYADHVRVDLQAIQTMDEVNEQVRGMEIADSVLGELLEEVNIDKIDQLNDSLSECFGRIDEAEEALKSCKEEITDDDLMAGLEELEREENEKEQKKKDEENMREIEKETDKEIKKIEEKEGEEAQVEKEGNEENKEKKEEKGEMEKEKEKEEEEEQEEEEEREKELALT